MSVATSVAAVDESSLLDVPEETVHSTRLIQWIHDSNPPQVTSGNQQEPVTGKQTHTHTHTHTHTPVSYTHLDVYKRQA